LGSHYASAGVVHLGHGATRFCAKRRASQARERFKSIPGLGLCKLARAFGQVAVVLRQYFASFVFFYVFASDDPIPAKRGESVVNAAVEIRIAPRTGGVVEEQRRVFFNRAVCRASGIQSDFTHRNADAFGVVLDIYAARVWKLKPAGRLAFGFL